MQFGEQCIGEMVKYKWRTSGSGVVCVDKPGTCKRNLCECDLDYAKKMPEQLSHFNRDYHLFWSTTGWDPRGDTGSCLKMTGVRYLRTCVGLLRNDWCYVRTRRCLNKCAINLARGKIVVLDSVFVEQYLNMRFTRKVENYLTAPHFLRIVAPLAGELNRREISRQSLTRNLLSEPECCGPPTGPLTIFNSLNKQCCDDHSIQPYGMCPWK